MIELLQQQIIPGMTGEEKLNRIREFLQLTTLKIFCDRGYFRQLAFVGGTALRVLYDLRRFSEDLDFSVVKKKSYDFTDLAVSLGKELKLHGLSVEMKVKEDRTVQSAMVKFPGLLKELGISALKEQKLSIKIEIDSRPPAGWHTRTTLVNRVYLLPILHFDMPSLYATKLHACFFRKYTKGRDFYDFVWYLGRKIEPNLVLLNNAVKQTEGKDLNLDEESLRKFVRKRIEKIDFRAVKRDVERFVEDKNELKLLSRSKIAELLGTD